MVKFSCGCLISIFVIGIPMEQPGHQTGASPETEMPVKVTYNTVPYESVIHP